MNSPKPPKIFALAYKEGAEEEAEAVANFLKENGVKVQENCPLQDRKLKECLSAGQVVVFIALGGEGSMLSASHRCAKARVPILGINMGSFGFLMECRKNDWRESCAFA